jgi:hypothetical protein
MESSGEECVCLWDLPVGLHPESTNTGNAFFRKHGKSIQELLSSHVMHTFLLGPFSTLKMEVKLSAETSVQTRTTGRYISEHGNIQKQVEFLQTPRRKISEAVKCSLKHS